MRRIIKEIFNKEEGILKEDIEKFIIGLQPKESLDLEYKSTDRLKKGLTEEKEGKKIEKKEEVLIQPLVAFLNKFSTEGGLLILGIYDEDGFPKKIAASDKGLFTSEQFISWIHSNISSIPPMKDSFRIDIKEIDAEKKPIFLIEIHPLDIHVVYFSKITNSVYVRRNDQSITLSLTEAYKLISEKICPKVFILIEMKERKLEKSFIKIKLKLNFINEGFKPGEWVRSIMSFKLIKGDPEKVKITPSREWMRVEKDSGDLIALQSNTWLKEITYPRIPMGVGNITLNLEQNDELYLNNVIYEKEGFSYQRFLIDSKRIIEQIKKFDSYINIS